ncbi:MAG: hypothetical protein U0169_14025 [Polyangiaceae bacterium]
MVSLSRKASRTPNSTPIAKRLALVLGTATLAFAQVACGATVAEPEGTADQAGTGAAEKLASAKDSLQSTIRGLDTARYVLESGLVTSLYAKEMCSCLYVSKMPEAECLDQVKVPLDVKEVNAVLERNGLEIDVSSENLVRVKAKVEKDKDGRITSATVTAEGIVSGPIARVLGVNSRVNPRTVASFDAAHPQFGCRITAKDGVAMP